MKGMSKGINNQEINQQRSHYILQKLEKKEMLVANKINSIQFKTNVNKYSYSKR